MVRWHWFALACLLLLPPVMAQPSPSAQPGPFLRFDGLNIYFGNQSYLSLFSCVDGQCHPGFGSITPVDQYYYSSQGFPIEDRYVELRVNYSLDFAPPCAIKLAASQLFEVSAPAGPAQMRFSAGNNLYGLELADNQSVEVLIEANGTQLCITPDAKAGFMHLYLIPLASQSPSAATRQSPSTSPQQPGPAQQSPSASTTQPSPAQQSPSASTTQPSSTPPEVVPSANPDDTWVSNTPAFFFPPGPVLSAAARPPKPREQPAMLPAVFVIIPLLVVLALMLLFLLRKPKKKSEQKIILPDLSE